jgi:hypothetical protein
VIAYIETKITRMFDEMPSGGRFNETTTTYDTIDCCDAFDAEQEVRRRKSNLADKYTDKFVWFDVKRISLDEFELACVKDEAFERKFAI